MIQSQTRRLPKPLRFVLATLSILSIPPSKQSVEQWGILPPLGYILNKLSLQHQISLWLMDELIRHAQRKVACVTVRLLKLQDRRKRGRFSRVSKGRSDVTEKKGEGTGERCLNNHKGWYSKANHHIRYSWAIFFGLLHDNEGKSLFYESKLFPSGISVHISQSNVSGNWL